MHLHFYIDTTTLADGNYDLVLEDNNRGLSEAQVNQGGISEAQVSLDGISEDMNQSSVTVGYHNYGAP